jgi:hypothetical protein
MSSASPRKADVERRSFQVRFVPICDNPRSVRYGTLTHFNVWIWPNWRAGPGESTRASLSFSDRLCRRDRDRSDRTPLIVEAMLALPANPITLDGEGVVVDDRGVSGGLGCGARAGSKKPACASCRCVTT